MNTASDLFHLIRFCAFLDDNALCELSGGDGQEKTWSSWECLWKEISSCQATKMHLKMETKYKQTRRRNLVHEGDFSQALTNSIFRRLDTLKSDSWV